MQRIATASSAVRRTPSTSGAAPLRLPIFVGLLVGLLPATAALSGCGGPKSPPKVPIVTAPEVVVPTPAAPADPTLFAYLHIGDPIQFVQQTLGGQYIEYAVQRGIKVADFQSGAPLVGLLWDPQGASLKEVPAVVLAPLPSDGDLAGLIKSTSPLLRTAPFSQSKTATVITLGDAAQERAKASEAALLALTQAKQPFEATLHVNATPIMAKYGPLMHAGIKNMAPMLATAAAQSPSAPDPQSSVAMLDQMTKGRAFAGFARGYQPRWVNVDIRLRNKTRLLGLAEMRSRPELATMEVLRPGSRLSITPVTETEWAAVMQLLNRP